MTRARSRALGLGCDLNSWSASWLTESLLERRNRPSAECAGNGVQGGRVAAPVARWSRVAPRASPGTPPASGEVPDAAASTRPAASRGRVLRRTFLRRHGFPPGFDQEG